jgi:hypothetical protein
MEDGIAARIRDFLRRWVGDRAQDALLDLKPLRGGLQASHVALVTARYTDVDSRDRVLRFVIKQLEGQLSREAIIYERVALVHAADLSPRVLGIDRSCPESPLLYVEAIRRICAWPWRELSLSRELLARLARFHAAGDASSECVLDWNYEAELGRIAVETREALDRCRCDADLGVLARALPALDRMVLGMDRLRRQLLSEKPFGASLLHGDVHPGNAIVRRNNRTDAPVLIDWARARLGSPLEDVSSWLHSLGFWEAEARRHHDTLFEAYLAARGIECRLTADMRAAYWLASASNALAGALMHHLQAATLRGQSPARRMSAVQAARAWLRVIRRADAFWS